MLFAFSSLAIIACTWLCATGKVPPNPTTLANVAYGILGASGALGVFFLWGGMWRYWMLGRPANRILRRLCFLLLVAGVWYGAVLYYSVVYLPTRGNQDTLGFERREGETVPGPLLRKFRALLIAGWIAPFLFSALLIAFPKFASQLLGSALTYAPQLFMLVVFLGSAVYLLMRLYGAGMGSAKRPDKEK
ncbi:MAG TPA: hypothetical protein VGR47_13325 [Terracidiphilus sp.]|nr:hypothetical protein [Terracidiphilus sp.]